MQDNILIIDDDKRLRELLEDYLTEKKYKIYLCDDFLSAVDIVEYFIFDLIIVDRMMPSGDGIDLINSLAVASGINGMVGGQALDIIAEKSLTALDLNSIKKMQSLKTGALFTWATEVGPRLSQNDIKPFTNFACCMGLAFQIQDDILDVVGKTEETGKALRKDGNAGKATFVSLLGLSDAKKKAVLLIEQANKNIEKYGEKAAMLRELAKFCVERGF